LEAEGAGGKGEPTEKQRREEGGGRRQGGGRKYLV
jgi:hypothetical protein